MCSAYHHYNKSTILSELEQAIKRKIVGKSKNKNQGYPNAYKTMAQKPHCSIGSDKKRNIITANKGVEQQRGKSGTMQPRNTNHDKPLSLFNNNQNYDKLLIMMPNQSNQPSKRAQPRRTEKLISLINYTLKSAEKLMKHMDVNDFEGEFAVKLFNSDRDNLLNQIKKISAQEVIDSQRVDSKASEITLGLTLHALHCENAKLRKEVHQLSRGKETATEGESEYFYNDHLMVLKYQEVLERLKGRSFKQKLTHVLQEEAKLNTLHKQISTGSSESLVENAHLSHVSDSLKSLLAQKLSLCESAKQTDDSAQWVKTKEYIQSLVSESLINEQAHLPALQKYISALRNTRREKKLESEQEKLQEIRGEKETLIQEIKCMKDNLLQLGEYSTLQVEKEDCEEFIRHVLQTLRVLIEQIDKDCAEPSLCPASSPLGNRDQYFKQLVGSFQCILKDYTQLQEQFELVAYKAQQSQKQLELVAYKAQESQKQLEQLQEDWNQQQDRKERVQLQTDLNQRQIEQLKQKNSLLESEITSLKTLIANQIENHDSQLAQRDQIIRGQQTEIDGLTSTLRTLKQTMGALREQLLSSQQCIEEERRKRQQQSKRTENTKHMGANTDYQMSLQFQLSQSDIYNQQLQTANQKQQQALEDARKELSDLTQRMHADQEELAAHAHTVAELQSQLCRTQQQLSTVSEKLQHGHSQQVEQLTSAHNRKMQQLSQAYQMKLNILEKAVHSQQDSKQETCALRQTVEELSRLKEHKQQENSKLQQKIQQLTGQCERIEGQYEQMSRQCQEVGEQLKRQEIRGKEKEQALRDQLTQHHRGHTEAVQQLNYEHTETVKQLKNDHTQTLQQLNDEHTKTVKQQHLECQTLKQQLTDKLRKLEQLQSEHKQSDVLKQREFDQLAESLTNKLVEREQQHIEQIDQLQKQWLSKQQEINRQWEEHIAQKQEHTNPKSNVEPEQQPDPGTINQLTQQLEEERQIRKQLNEKLEELLSRIESLQDKVQEYEAKDSRESDTLQVSEHPSSPIKTIQLQSSGSQAQASLSQLSLLKIEKTELMEQLRINKECMQNYELTMEQYSTKIKQLETNSEEQKSETERIRQLEEAMAEYSQQQIIGQMKEKQYCNLIKRILRASIDLDQIASADEIADMGIETLLEVGASKVMQERIRKREQESNERKGSKREPIQHQECQLFTTHDQFEQEQQARRRDDGNTSEVQTLNLDSKSVNNCQNVDHRVPLAGLSSHGSDGEQKIEITLKSENSQPSQGQEQHSLHGIEDFNELEAQSLGSSMISEQEGTGKAGTTSESHQAGTGGRQHQAGTMRQQVQTESQAGGVLAVEECGLDEFDKLAVSDLDGSIMSQCQNVGNQRLNELELSVIQHSENMGESGNCANGEEDIIGFREFGEIISDNMSESMASGTPIKQLGKQNEDAADFGDFNDFESQKMSQSMISDTEGLHDGPIEHSAQQGADAADFGDFNDFESQKMSQSMISDTEGFHQPIPHSNEAADFGDFNDFESQKMSESMVSEPEGEYQNQEIRKQSQSKEASPAGFDDFGVLASEKMSESMISDSDRD